MDTDYYRMQRTVEQPLELEGIGIHTGEETSLRIEPADAGDGLVFLRTDLPEPVRFHPDVSMVRETSRGIVLGNDGETLHTVEHLMAALFGLGVSECTVRVEGPEIPALDGSARGFVEALREAGLKQLQQSRPVYRVKEPMYVQEGESLLVLLPATECGVTATISYENEYIGDQYHATTLSPDRFTEEIAPARTYGFKEEVEELRENELARGGSLENAIVLDEEGNLLGDSPQFPDEFVRHKILDILGDLALAGGFFVGRVVAVKNGHSLNVALAEKLRDKIHSSAKSREDRHRTGGEEVADIDRIKEVLPHRYPFLLLDRILSVDHEKEVAVGLKNVTMNERFFQGHFPDDPVMPGVLILEAIAQLGAYWVLDNPETQGKNSYFMGVDDVKWRRPVRPGDQLVIEVEGKRIRTSMGSMEGRAYVEGELAAEGVFKFALVGS